MIIGGSTARTIMFQGTASHVGKSVLATAMCAILTREGHRVAPFKSQNMALNSAVTADGGEIGRAQAAQADACGIEATTDMNPILLKPTSTRRAQVIIHGRAIGDLDGEEYRFRRTEMLEVALAALERLRAEYDVVVIEGAGSPAEVNLRSSDIVNMEIARAADSPVILVADIDKGGAFASLVGTLELLTWRDRQRIRGIILNKFRGDAGLLGEAIAFVERKCNAPVLGVVPWVSETGIDAEDSVCLEQRAQDNGAIGADVAVIKLPYISNFTDFQPLADSGANVRYVQTVAELGRPDALIIPGTKDSLGDLCFMNKSGLAAAVASLARQKVPVLGICGGYQMLGKMLHEKGETDRQEAGLGLLPIETVMHTEKRTARTRGRVATLVGPCSVLSGHSIEGYEIHHGVTTSSTEISPFAMLGENGNSRAEGACHAELPVFGTYVHGLFDSIGFREAFLNWIGQTDDVKPVVSGRQFTNEMERFVDLVTEALDIPKLRDIIFESDKCRDILPPLAVHGGAGCDVRVDLSQNVNPLGPMREWFADGTDDTDVSSYRETGLLELRATAAARYKVPEDTVTPGAGSAELIYRIMALTRPARALVVAPTFSEYSRAAVIHGGLVDTFQLDSDFTLDADALIGKVAGYDIVFVCNPNNPTGSLFERRELLLVAQAMEDRGILVVDEAFMDFVPGDAYSLAGLAPAADNIVVLRSMGKMYSLAGARIGLAIGNPTFAELLRRQAPPWLVNRAGVLIATRALGDSDFLESSIEFTQKQRHLLEGRLRDMPGIQTFPSAANFVLLKATRPAAQARRLWQMLGVRGIAVRECRSFTGLDESFARVAVSTVENNESFISVLREVLDA